MIASLQLSGLGIVSLKMSSKWLILSAAILISPASHVQSQHSTCENDGITLSCRAGGYILPANFHTDAIRGKETISSLTISGNGNTGLEHLVPLPRMANLQSVYLSAFNQGIDTRFPLSLFFNNTKSTVKRLSLVYVKLLTFTAADMQGFSRLEDLQIAGGDLRTIAVDVFGELGYGPFNAILPSYTPRLSQLAVSMNPQLTEIDWGFLAPLSDNLLSLNLNANGIRRIWSSVKFHFQIAFGIQLSGNALTTPPLDVLETLTGMPPAVVKVDFSRNRMCRNIQDGDCSCCELAAFGAWARQHNLAKSSFTLTCGPSGHPPVSLFTNSSLHQHCTEPLPEKPVPEEPEPEPTGTTAKPSLPCTPVDPELCRPEIPPVIANCFTGVLTKPSVDLETVEATDFKLESDQSRRCGAVAYELHTWLLEKAGLRRSGTLRGLSDIGVVATCRGSGVLTVNQLDPEVMEANNVALNIANTKKCRDVFYEFLGHFLSLR